MVSSVTAADEDLGATSAAKQMDNSQLLYKTFS